MGLLSGKTRIELMDTENVPIRKMKDAEDLINWAEQVNDKIDEREEKGRAIAVKKNKKGKVLYAQLLEFPFPNYSDFDLLLDHFYGVKEFPFDESLLRGLPKEEKRKKRGMEEKETDVSSRIDSLEQQILSQQNSFSSLEATQQRFEVEVQQILEKQSLLVLEELEKERAKIETYKGALEEKTKEMQETLNSFSESLREKMTDTTKNNCEEGARNDEEEKTECSTPHLVDEEAIKTSFSALVDVERLVKERNQLEEKIANALKDYDLQREKIESLFTHE